MKPNLSPAAGSVPVQFAALALAWGASFLFIRLGLEGLSPAQVVLGRLLAGALTLGLVSLFTRSRLPAEPVVWAHLSVVAILLSVAPFTLFAWAELHISSGLASIYNATTALTTALVALAALPSERLTRARLAGLLAGFAGVVVVLGPGAGWPAAAPWARRPASARPPATEWRSSTCAGSSHLAACRPCRSRPSRSAWPPP
jgi:drug/metabolite transporter (DMT)-like permease